MPKYGMSVTSQIAGSGADDSSSGNTAWNTPNNITANDGSLASIASFAPRSHYLVSSNHGFSLASSEIIDGISVTVERSSSGTVTDSHLTLRKAGANAGNDIGAAGAWGTSETVTFGSSTELWGTTWTYSDINNSGFGFALAADGDGVCSMSVDYITINVYHHADDVDVPATYNETGSGGVVVGGVAITRIIFVAKGGVVVGGTSRPTGSQSVTASGGVVAGGVAQLGYKFDQVGSGGVVAGGASRMSVTFSEIGHGGTVAGGSSIPNGSQNITATGGVVVNSAQWLYRRLLIVPDGRVGSNLDKFYLPVAIKLDPQKASSSVKFTDATGINQLAHELRDYDTETGELFAFVKMPLQASADNVFFIFYGDNT